ncbi:thiamine pyrophosphokinase [Plectosphaerella plurivora]|uniref:Thiamine pyrophosphokinase n=1 Tax=Plectosphaerella plurivora TaxID=936078 RepID=A0A9P9A491_9PEZI|nr:thiamine pyrophosphokinase [Plectosphaerella plurivora]
MAAPRSNLDLANDIDSFPYESNQEAFAKAQEGLFTFMWEDESGQYPLGYLPAAVVERLSETQIEYRGEIKVDTAKRTLFAFQQANEEERSRQFARLADHWRVQDAFPVLRGWRNELWPVYDRKGDLLLSMERGATGLFGIMRYGVHLTAYVRDPSASHGIKVWVARRSPTKSTFPGMLDNAAAGGLMTGEDPDECIVREANEEADLDEDFARQHIKPSGGVTYVYITHKEAGQAGLIYPEVQWIYDLELPASVRPTPKDGEVADFTLCSVEEIRQQLAAGEYKPNSGLVMIDFFIRHGILTPENEPDFAEINRRLHRRLPFPGPKNLDPQLHTGSV